MSTKQYLVPVLALSLIFSGCASTSTNAEKGAAIGAITGAILGKSTSNHKNKRAIFGAAIGAIAGAAVGDYMDKQEQEFKRELAGSGIDVVREGDNLRLIMPANITFASNQSTITASFHQSLNDVAKVLSKYNKTLLSIEGHTDSSGSQGYNQNLSEQRAESVKVYLMHQNILASRLQTTGFGELRPMVGNGTVSDRALNRRVEVQIVPNQA
ncbi:OmpA family protein [Thalassotalea sp. ND16A]|uniref:OmpA family protein n=1 Tax=Thalassotalea sp. ND16A TaxID=1535422 RepID=UPI00051A1C15|nr:OmpA family protein [Thalassotalea sp. ND16A]KGJ87915.1 hypothetical protein ND16A_2829 [Thalassotalea sp. ND16A]